ncbi:TetR family transcriptional regulator [Uliginosibacterium sp. sgz301328]|uniref:TetR family transcriptional regulator n=1 Tax=Uliginosibacterium sp. sgz301328 TaxID=3243764 RepID=UPI00359D8E7E
MVRKTKVETEKTRQDIIAAARDMFAEHGVTRTTLEQIAHAAGVTRGAVYWHFANKLDLMVALRDDVLMPLIEELQDTLQVEDGRDPLTAIESFLLMHIDRLEADPVMRQTFEVLMNKCEYVGEFGVLLQCAFERTHDKHQRLEHAYARAIEHGSMRGGVDPVAAALDTHAFMYGIVRLWIGKSAAEDNSFRPLCRQMVRDHIQLRRA